MVAALILFVVASAGIAYLSRHSLEAPHSHGFYRFFAWEFILGLVFVNWPHWFQDPLSLRQIISWLLLTASAVLVFHGAYLLQRVGKPSKQRNDDRTLIGIERTTTLVTVGAFKYIRHPVYTSLLCLAWGVFLKSPLRPGGVLAFAATICLVVTARIEEVECRRFFGAAYVAYIKHTKMFVPFLI